MDLKFLPTNNVSNQNCDRIYFVRFSWIYDNNFQNTLNLLVELELVCSCHGDKFQVKAFIYWNLLKLIGLSAIGTEFKDINYPLKLNWSRFK